MERFDTYRYEWREEVSDFGAQRINLHVEAPWNINIMMNVVIIDSMHKR